MRAATLAVLVVMLTALLAGAGAGVAGREGDGFGYGVAAGEITPTSAKLWTRAPKAGAVVLTVVEATKTPTVRTFTVRAVAANDLTVQRVVAGLAPATEYRYTFAQVGVGWGERAWSVPHGAAADGKRQSALRDLGRRRCNPRRERQAGIQQLRGLRAHGRRAQRFQHQPRRHDLLGQRALGLQAGADRSGEVAEVPVRPRASDPAALARRAPVSTASRTTTSSSTTSRVPEFGKPLYQAGVKAFTDYAPVSWKPASGLYRTFRWGKNLELFLLDERSFRSAKVANARAAGDLAPTAPAAVRAAFATLIPSLAGPSPQAAATRSTTRRGRCSAARQEAAFLKAIEASTATFKVVVNEVPMQQFYQLPYDRWEGYAADADAASRSASPACRTSSS